LRRSMSQVDRSDAEPQSLVFSVFLVDPARQSAGLDATSTCTHSSFGWNDLPSLSYLDPPFCVTPGRARVWRPSARDVDMSTCRLDLSHASQDWAERDSTELLIPVSYPISSLRVYSNRHGPRHSWDPVFRRESRSAHVPQTTCACLLRGSSP
jgi:hypothetical protein